MKFTPSPISLPSLVKIAHVHTVVRKPGQAVNALIADRLNTGRPATQRISHARCIRRGRYLFLKTDGRAFGTQFPRRIIGHH
jgi:hypothetical protein